MGFMIELFNARSARKKCWMVIAWMSAFYASKQVMPLLVWD
jgi:hypothetical protein